METTEHIYIYIYIYIIQTSADASYIKCCEDTYEASSPVMAVVVLNMHLVFQANRIKTAV